VYLHEIVRIMKTLYITKGHQIINGVGNGANHNGFDEAVEARDLVNDLAKELWKKHNVFTYADDDADSLSTVISWLVSKVKKGDISIDVHFNAYSKSAANGTEVFVPSMATKEEKLFAEKVASTISKTLGINNRGVKTASASQHSSLGILEKPHLATNILIEVCFITNDKDVAQYRKNYKELIKNLAKVIAEEIN
jgi:N-acetylmuramoyl-L-alanine amidase